jgi:hypothetical protein
MLINTVPGQEYGSAHTRREQRKQSVQGGLTTRTNPPGIPYPQQRIRHEFPGTACDEAHLPELLVIGTRHSVITTL